MTFDKRKKQQNYFNKDQPHQNHEEYNTHCQNNKNKQNLPGLISTIADIRKSVGVDLQFAPLFMDTHVIKNSFHGISLKNPFTNSAKNQSENHHHSFSTTSKQQEQVIFDSISESSLSKLPSSYSSPNINNNHQDSNETLITNEQFEKQQQEFTTYLMNQPHDKFDPTIHKELLGTSKKELFLQRFKTPSFNPKQMLSQVKQNLKKSQSKRPKWGKVCIVDE